jgi:hypothetical protein
MGKTFSAALAVIAAVLAAIFRPVHDALLGYLQRTGRQQDLQPRSGGNAVRVGPG